MNKFEKVSRFKNDNSFDLPKRGTASSAGYDLTVAEDIIIPSYAEQMHILTAVAGGDINRFPVIDLDIMKNLTKSSGIKPTLVSTGVKCYLDEGCYLELSVRSSTPLKYWLILANSVGIIDADYADNPDNEGEIFLQLINLSPFNIQLHKGDVIGQGIIKPYCVTVDDAAEGQRMGGFGSTNG